MVAKLQICARFCVCFGSVGEKKRRGVVDKTAKETKEEHSRRVR